MFFEGTKNHWLSKDKTYHVIILGFCLLPIFLQKHLKELTLVSIILFVGVALFIIIISVQLAYYGNFENPDLNETTEYMNIETNFNLVKGISMILVAYSFQ